MAEIKLRGSSHLCTVLTFAQGKKYAWVDRSGPILVRKISNSNEYILVDIRKLVQDSKNTELLIELLKVLSQYLAVSEVIES